MKKHVNLKLAVMALLMAALTIQVSGQEGQRGQRPGGGPGGPGRGFQMTEEDIKELEKDPSQAPLEDNERAMLAFVIKAIKTPDAVTQEDVDQLHEMGWADRDILDALAHGTNMIGSSILMKTFKMDMNC